MLLHTVVERQDDITLEELRTRLASHGAGTPASKRVLTDLETVLH